MLYGVPFFVISLLYLTTIVCKFDYDSHSEFKN